MSKKVNDLMGKLTRLLPGEVNEEIAEEAGTSTAWVSQVRNNRKQSSPVQRAIAQVAKRKAVEAGQLADEILQELGE